MNEMELLRELRAGLPAPPAEARARARGRLVAGIEELQRPRRVPRARRVRGFAWPSGRLRLLAAGAVAAVLAALVLVLGVFAGGGRVESAAAEALHRTAAEAGDTAALPAPGPGQFLYTKTKKVELQGWMPHGHQGTKDEPRVFTAHVEDPYPQALVTTLVEKWTAPDGTIQQRETLQPIHFFDPTDQRRWEAAGSPQPWSFDPRFQDVGRGPTGRPVKEFETRKWAPDISFPDPAELPTDPKQLRLAVERGQVRPPWVLETNMSSMGGKVPAKYRHLETIEQLSEILEKPTTTAALRAAVFNALAEIPGIRVDRDVTDVAGRHGEAIVAFGEGGLRRDYTYDPDTAELLAKGETVIGPKAIHRAVPVGAPFRQSAYLRAAIVDSESETGG